MIKITLKRTGRNYGLPTSLLCGNLKLRKIKALGSLKLFDLKQKFAKISEVGITQNFILDNHLRAPIFLGRNFPQVV